MTHQSTHETPHGNVTPWVSVDAVLAQFPVRVRFLKLTEPIEDHFFAPEEARLVAHALIVAADAADSTGNPGGKA